jgi:adenine specific DNA methylase Mod
MTKEQKFYKTLQDAFVGAKVEGTGGFVNLMKIKSNYYFKIERFLKNDIEKALNKYNSFRDELFDKLYSFFSRYFTESGSIYFNSTPFHNNIYERVYTDDKDVMLFWKTQMLYYVKTDKIFRSMPVEFDGLKFYFDAATIENKKANEKRSLIYEFKEAKEDKTIVFNVYYSEKGRVTKTEDILKELKKKHISINEEQLEKAFRVFEKQSELDFFINKNAKAFLQEQFKLWSYQYFWEGAKEWTADRVNQLQILKDIAFKIIDFISQFEDELVKIWNKPKFVKNSNYVITLDRIKDINLIERILEHKNIKEQVNEWVKLDIVNQDFKIENVFENNLTGKYLSKKYEHLPIDTKYFKDLELEILSLFDDLDKALDGWLIKSENYQALNTILPKFKEKVQTIYIDPPFNLDSSDQFLYRTNYKDANWATLLENRLRIAKDWLNGKGSIFVRCDYNGNWIVRCLMDEIFGKENFRNEILVNRTSRLKNEGVRYYTSQDTLFFYSKSENIIFIQQKIEEPFEIELKLLDSTEPNKIGEILKNYFKDFDFKISGSKLLLRSQKWVEMHASSDKNDNPPITLFGKKYYPPKKRRWMWKDEEILKQMEKNGWIRINPNNNLPELLRTWRYLGSDWLEIPGYSQTQGFSTENSEILLKRVIETASKETDLILDFFLGSGTTTSVAHKLGRKWLGIEMGEHFYTVILPRMKKVLYYDKSGISKEVKEYQGGGFFKYYELEQYEETLANCKYEDGDLFNAPGKSPYQEYVFLKDEKMLKALEIDYENNKVKIDLSKLYENIDIAETLSNLTGKWIKKITAKEVEFINGEKIDLENLDYKLIKPLIWWE